MLRKNNRISVIWSLVPRHKRKLRSIMGKGKERLRRGKGGAKRKGRRTYHHKKDMRTMLKQTI